MLQHQLLSGVLNFGWLYGIHWLHPYSRAKHLGPSKFTKCVLFHFAPKITACFESLNVDLGQPSHPPIRVQNDNMNRSAESLGGKINGVSHHSINKKLAMCLVIRGGPPEPPKQGMCQYGPAPNCIEVTLLVVEPRCLRLSSHF